MTEKEINVVSWNSALKGLVILADQNEKLWLDLVIPSQEIKIAKQDKKRIKKSIKFIKYLLRS